MMRVLLIGTGRAAHHLGHAIMNAGHNVIGVVGRDEAKARSLADELGTVSLAFDAVWPEHDVALIAVSDDALLVMEVNDHGNVTLYNRRRQEDWGCI